MDTLGPITGELLRLKEEIESYALSYGLDFYPVIFESCDYDTINILAAQGGFPSRYPHWRFGMDYDQMYKGYAYGLQKIYEMVINTDPCYAYLLSANNLVDQKIVMAHVYGHADFFKNNIWFGHTNRNMMDVMANYGSKIRRFMDRYGQDKVEEFIDRVLSLDNLLDVSVLFEKDSAQNFKKEQKNGTGDELPADGTDQTRAKALQSFIKSRDHDKGDDLKKDADIDPTKVKETIRAPRDILRFLLENAPIEEWEADVIGMLRQEAYYFLPQRMTKIMNEGWASYWHSTIMTQNALKSSEIIHYAHAHSGVMAMSKKQINPYKIGLELFRDIEERWNMGRFGPEYENCPNMEQKESWNTSANLGRKKIFEVRKTHNDLTFIDEFFTEEFCHRQKLFAYDLNPMTGRVEISSRDFKEVKNRLLTQLTNFGTPVIEIETANYKNRNELLLRHRFDGVDIDMNMANETMKNLFFIWKRPVNVVTMSEGKELFLSYNGKDFVKSTN